MENAILMVHTLEIQPLPFLLQNHGFPILIIFSVCYLILHCLEESGLDLIEDLLTVLTILTVIHFVVLPLIHLLILLYIDPMDKAFQYLRINYTSVVYPLTVLILPISSLLIYSVSYLIVLASTYCHLL